MGKASSKIISLAEARRRCGPEEWDRFSRAFDRICDRNGKVDKDTFRDAILGFHVPKELADRIFYVLNTRKSGYLDKEEFLCGMAIFSQGSPEERLKFLFRVYDEDNKGHLSRKEMLHFLRVIREAAPSGGGGGGNVSLNAWFDQADLNNDDRLSLAEFSAWASEAMVPGLITWIWELRPPSDPPKARHWRASAPESLRKRAGGVWHGRRASVADVTHFSDREITDLEKQYHRIRTQSQRVDKETLANLFSPALPQALLSRIFAAFQTDERGEIDVREFICGLSSCCRGSEEEKLDFCFKAFDEDGDGRLSKEEMLRMIQSLWKMDAIHANLSEKKELGQQGDDLESLVDAAFAEFDAANTGYIDRSGFQAWCAQNPMALSFLDKIRQFTSVQLGLRPSGPDEERELVLDALRKKVELREGSTLYVLSSKWRDAWARYVGMDEKDLEEVNTLCSLDQPVLVDNTTVDVSSPEADGSDSSTSVHERPHPPPSPPSQPPSQPPPQGQEQEQAQPGPIDNTDLLKEGSESSTLLTLRPNLIKIQDYTVVPERVWIPLSNWYNGGPPLPRTVIATANGSERVLMVELYPLALHCYTTGPKREVECIFSRAGTIEALQRKLCDMMSLDASRVRLWDTFRPNEPQLLNVSQTLEDSRIVDGQQIFVEVQRADGSWPGVPGVTAPPAVAVQKTNKNQTGEAPLGDASWPLPFPLRLPPETLAQHKKKQRHLFGGRHTSASFSSPSVDTDVKCATPYANAGRCGLYNLGNTCFMNSAIQSLNACVPLTHYFLSELYVRELNRDNPLGMQGKVALQYGALLKMMWRERPFGAVAPRNLKWTIGKFQPQFVGNLQQDAQELLTFLLDGLHEGLNRVREKPYVENKDSDGRPDEVVAAEYWGNFLSRNQSIIVDLFYGQVRSVTRWSCGRESVVFDPWACLSLPLPKQLRRFIEVVVVFHQASRAPVRHSVEVQEHHRLSDLRAQLSELCGVPADRLYLADVYNHVIYKFLHSATLIRDIRPSDVFYAYETPPRLASAAAAANGDKDKEKEKVQAPETENGIAEHPDDEQSGFAIGAKFDVLDTVNKWLPAVVAAVSWKLEPPPAPAAAPKEPPNDGAKYVLIHYANWNSRWDEWLPLDSPRIAPFGSRCLIQQRAPPYQPQMRTAQEELALPSNTIVLHFLHRRLEAVSDYVLHPYKPVLFGVPILLFVQPPQTTCAGLYEMIWEKVRRYATLPSVGGADQLFEAAAEAPHQNGSDPVEALPTRQRDRSFSFSFSAMPPSRQQAQRVLPPFILRLVNRVGTHCSECSWLKQCNGHILDFSDEPLRLRNDATLAIDWNPEFFERHFSRREFEETWEHESVAQHRKILSRAISFGDCLRHFCEEEVLDGNSSPYCATCKKHHAATKKMDLWTAPPILVLHLKRLITTSAHHRYKLMTMVDFPLEGLVLGPYLAHAKKTTDEQKDPAPATEIQTRPCQSESELEPYDLFAVVNHFGNSGAGHYVTYALNNVDGKWYCYDDSRVTELSPHQIVRNSAYVLFYIRRDLRWDPRALSLLPSTLRSQLGMSLGPELTKQLQLMEKEANDGKEPLKRLARASPDSCLRCMLS